MATTVQKVFVRKYGDMAVVMTITDWKQYEELMEHADEGNESPDFMMEGTTTKNIYSNMLPSTIVRTDNAKDISKETKGMGLGHILTSPYWGFKTIKNPLDDLLG